MVEKGGGERREKRGEAGSKALAKHTRLNLTHPLAVCWVFQDTPRGRTNLDGYLLTHTAFCYPYRTFSRLHSRPRVLPPRQLSSSAAHYLSSPPSRQYCIVLKPRLACCGLTKAGARPTPGAARTRSPPTPCRPSPFNPPCTRSTPWCRRVQNTLYYSRSNLNRK